MDNNVRSSESARPPHWAEELLRAFLRPDQAETAFGDLLEAYRDSILPQRGRVRANLWFVLQVVIYVLKLGIKPRHCVAAAAVLTFWSLALLFGGGITLLATLFGSVVTVTALPILAVVKKRPIVAAKLFLVWACYLGFYILVSTGMAAYAHYIQPFPVVPIGRELCADAGCFAVERVEESSAGSQTTYTLFWHLASNDRQMSKRFPGRFMEVYIFDERGRTFKLPANANQNPLDVLIPAGQTVRDTMTFSVPSDAQRVFMTAKYRPFTFPSLLPGELSLVNLPHRVILAIR